MMASVFGIIHPAVNVLIPCSQLWSLKRNSRSMNNSSEACFRKSVNYEARIYSISKADKTSKTVRDVDADIYVPVEPLCDFLGANKFGKKFLIGGDNEGKQLVPIESFRGKILALYFADSLSGYGGINFDRTKVPYLYIEFYNTLKRTKPDASFEMIYIAAPDYDPSHFNAVISTIPWPSVPFDDHHWRSYLFNLYDIHAKDNIVFIDTKDNKIQVLAKNNWLFNFIADYGPLSYPFTDERRQQLDAECIQLGTETSISAILGSDTCDYLMDPQSNKVPISSLQDKDVLIYGFVQEYPSEALHLVSQLREIHDKFQNQGFEMVSINFDHNGGNGEYETLWKDHLEHISWLHLPVGNEKIWLLRTMMDNLYFAEFIRPTLFVKPKGESLLDPYGYHVLENYGFQAFPFTRKAAALSVLSSLKGLSFMSFVDKASQLGLDFNYLIRNKADGGTELVSLSTILEGRVRGILLLFASVQSCSRERLKSLINVYLSQNDSSHSFEVIFISMGTDPQSFNDLFSLMPWFAFHRPLDVQEYNVLGDTMKHADINFCNCFLAFGPDQLLLQVGQLTESFENRVFPFVNDAESTDYLYDLITAIFERWA